MKRLIILTAIMALTVTWACADTFSGTVNALRTEQLLIPADGVLEAFDLEVGQTLSAGEQVGHVRPTKVFSPLTGTVAAVHLEVGDSADGTVLEIDPLSKYTVTCTITGYAKTVENALIHSGETLHIRCTADGTHRATGIVTTITGAEYTVEVTGGELYVGETVYLYRDPACRTESLVGKGTVTAHDTTPISGSGVILTLRAGVGDTVERGQWLFSTASDDQTAVISPVTGVVTEVNVKKGASVREEQAAALIAVGRTLRVSVTADDAPLFSKGDTWYYTRNDDSHETHLPATVLRVLTNENDASATVELSPQDDSLPLGLGIYITDEAD